GDGPGEGAGAFDRWLFGFGYSGAGEQLRSGDATGERAAVVLEAADHGRARSSVQRAAAGGDSKDFPEGGGAAREAAGACGAAASEPGMQLSAVGAEVVFARSADCAEADAGGAVQPVAMAAPAGGE